MLPAIRTGIAVAISLALPGSAGALTIVPGFIGSGWDATREAVVQHAIDDWQGSIQDAVSFAVDFEFASLGGAGPIGQWNGSYSLALGTDVYPWTTGVDHTIQFNTDFVGLWWDPTPTDAGGDQPGSTWDALSITLHELGHVLGFTEDFYYDDFGLPSQSDKWSTHVSGSPPVFDAGGLGVEMAGAGDLGHVADSGAMAGDLMVPALPNGTRRDISSTDLAMLELAYGMTVVPEPTTGALLLVGLALLARRPGGTRPRA